MVVLLDNVCSSILFSFGISQRFYEFWLLLFFLNLRLHHRVWSRWDSNSQPSDVLAKTQAIVPRSVARGMLLAQTSLHV